MGEIVIDGVHATQWGRSPCGDGSRGNTRRWLLERTPPTSLFLTPNTPFKTLANQ
jgi:hypothetical protein